jgi:hypothetical protein
MLEVPVYQCCNSYALQTCHVGTHAGQIISDRIVMHHVTLPTNLEKFCKGTAHVDNVAIVLASFLELKA